MSAIRIDSLYPIGKCYKNTNLKSENLKKRVEFGVDMCE